jgi:hypothetical protein
MLEVWADLNLSLFMLITSVNQPLVVTTLSITLTKKSSLTYIGVYVMNLTNKNEV